MRTVAAIYEALSAIAPFSTQEPWDNSGLLVGSMEMPVDRIYISLDISNAAVEAAHAAGAQLILSHHPVIFSPLKQLSPSHPVWKLAAAHMAAICMHTPLDMAETGINQALYAKMKAPLSLGAIVDTPDHSGCGWIAESAVAQEARTLAQTLQTLLGCTVVRYCPADRPIRKIALCSGAGGSFLDAVIAQGCDAYITGDVKHDAWYTARNAGLALLDCGHYHTEVIAQELLAHALETAFPDVTILCDQQGDPVSYVWGGDA
jgi:dinuclear metal center YbgI/SA1388 family protein